MNWHLKAAILQDFGSRTFLSQITQPVRWTESVRAMVEIGVTTAAEVGPELKTIAAALADRWGCTKREAYQALLKLESDRS